MSMLAMNALKYVKDTFSCGDPGLVAYYEQRIVSRSGMVIGTDIKIVDVVLHNGESIHTGIFGDPSLPPLILLHGFGGSFAVYYRIFQDLAKAFRVYAIDNPGTGLSHRPDFPYEKNEEVIDFFVSRIEMFRKTVGLTQFFLAGHSFGAYMSFYYTLKYPNSVRALFLISPAGFRDIDPNRDYMKQDINKLDWRLRMRVKSILFFSKKKLVPSHFIQALGPISKSAIRGFLKKRLEISGSELEDFANYVYEMLKLKVSSDKGLHSILHMGAYSRNPICDHIDEYVKHNIQTFIYYGDQDWMDGSKTVEACNKYPNLLSMKIIEDSGHQLQMENPKGLTTKILEDITNFLIEEKKKQSTNIILNNNVTNSNN